MRAVSRDQHQLVSGFAAELPVQGRTVLVAGGGENVVGRIAALRDAGADVHVVGADGRRHGRRSRRPRPGAVGPRAVTAADVAAAWLVIVAGDAATDAPVRGWAERARQDLPRPPGRPPVSSRSVAVRHGPAG